MASSFSIPGVASGMDWGGMVDEIIAKSQKAYQPLVTKRDNLERKITLYEEMNQAIRNIQTKLTTLKLSSTYKAKTTELARLDSNGLPQAVLTASVTGDAKVMNYDIEVLQKAMTMTRYSKKLTGTSVNKDSFFYLNAGGKRAKISVAKTDTFEDIARKINNSRDINNPTVPMDVTAMVVDGQLVVRSTKMGAGSDTKLSQSITRSNVGYDKMGFAPDLKNAIINGSVVIKNMVGGAERTYQIGLDFDIVNNEIRWRDFNPKAATAGSSYSLMYKTDPADELAYQVKRGEGSYDLGIFSTHTFKVDSTGTKVDLPGTFAVSFNGTNYQQGVDFEVTADGFRWISTNRPHEGATYSIKYTPLASGEEWRMPAITRTATDTPIATGSTLKTTSPSGVMTTTTNESAPKYADYRKYGGAAVITQGNRTWTEGIDFEMVSDGSPADGLQVKWKTEAGATAPEPGTAFNLKLNYASTSGLSTTKYEWTNNLTRTDSEKFKLDPLNPPFSSPPLGRLDGKIYADNGHIYDLFVTSNGVTQQAWDVDKNLNQLWHDPTLLATVKWTPPTFASSLRSVPRSGETYTVAYVGNMNVFSFDDTGDGILSLLGLEDTDVDPKDIPAQDAKISINGGSPRIYSSNTIAFTKDETVFDDLGNVVSLLGLTLNLKGIGKVQLDVSQDAEKAVTGIQEYITAYNELMEWINTRIAEKAVDESKKTGLSGDDFRMKWGLLFGDQLLANTKSKLRALVSHAQPLGFQSRTGREVLYGTLADAGMRRESGLTVRLGGQKATIDIEIVETDGTKRKVAASIGGFMVQVSLLPEDTLLTSAEKINAAMQNYEYTLKGENGAPDTTRVIPLGTATVKDGRIVVTSAFNTVAEEIPLMVSDSGSGVLKILGLNDKYTMQSQVGITTGVSGGSIATNAKTGLLEFDTQKFIEMLTADADAVSDLMVTNMKEMDKYLTNLSSSTQKEFAPGVIGIQGRVPSRIDQLRQEISSIDKTLKEADRRLSQKEESLYRMFSSAERNLAKMTQMSSSIGAALNMLTGQQQK